ncbi:acyltransferase [Cohnella thailandensis]|uniref:Acyltransferase n=1 Tax=Cohnella thailandensis TaxID=557557 RepID=A0A841TAC6_9BACL|nr:acyltransferase [Cohnella thailandensis]MBB6638171.1 acyltransferase [Cohnella thailandensis]MBP1971904.1 acetyltransferase-like isoleucine patch superfamily enzyme [Cohnella thailandensis]
MNFFSRAKRSISARIRTKIHRIKASKFIKQLNAKKSNLQIFGLPLTIINPENIKIGNNCRINEHVFFHGGGGILIGNDVTFSAYSKIISWTYDTSDWINNYVKKDHVGQLVEIGDGAWIGAGAIILPGVKIAGKGVIIAAGSVVTKDIREDFVLVGGIPARVIKSYNT